MLYCGKGAPAHTLNEANASVDVISFIRVCVDLSRLNYK